MPFSASNLRPLLLTMAIVSTVGFWTERAEAGCGDHVLILNQSAPSTPAKDQPTEPCQGPFCSNSPTTPAVPVPAPVFPFPDLKALSNNEFDLNDSLGKLSFAEPDAGISIHRPDPIFHPPRV